MAEVTVRTRPATRTRDTSADTAKLRLTVLPLERLRAKSMQPMNVTPRTFLVKSAGAGHLRGTCVHESQAARGWRRQAPGRSPGAIKLSKGYIPAPWRWYRPGSRNRVRIERFSPTTFLLRPV